MSLPPLARAGIFLLAALPLAACLAPEPEPEDWLAYGFRGPEEAFRSFLTALAGDRPVLEYTCLSQALKERQGGNLLGYLTLRDELHRKMPWLKAAARAEIEEVERLGQDRARLVARVDWMFWDETFAVQLVAEDFYEFWAEGERVEDGFYPFALRAERGNAVARVPAPEEADLDSISELRLGREWKIDSFELPDEAPQP
jgi:hypothetical protein